jgi:hypothetical protein
MMEATHTHPFDAGSGRSSTDVLDDKLRLALGRGLVAAYADVIQEPIPDRLKVWLHRLENRNGAHREGANDAR